MPLHAIKQHLVSVMLNKYIQPNTIVYSLNLSHVSLASKYEPGSTIREPNRLLPNKQHLKCVRVSAGFTVCSPCGIARSLPASRTPESPPAPYPHAHGARLHRCWMPPSIPADSQPAMECLPWAASTSCVVLAQRTESQFSKLPSQL
jgi:hypothetical protein